MLNNVLTNEKHLEHAQAILVLTEKYTGGFVQSLHLLDADIDRNLAASEQELDAIVGLVHEPNQELTTLLKNLRRWLSQSTDLQKARLVATSR